ncbi:transcription factor bHLH123-like [Populus nigra]|uniref:transcription factor bHLH123-like n=1 Tax=Populus nigra TaxID=3691 RepID=UPI002B26E68A|nr:transcription factor bHLH123-like [Populus nigra]
MLFVYNQFVSGNDEVQRPNLEVSMSMDAKINVRGTSFYLDSKVFNDGHQLRDGGFCIPYQSLASYQPVAGYQSVSSTCSNIPQQSMLLSKRVSITEVQMDFQAMQMRKRSIDELTNQLPRREPSDLIENKTALSTWKTNKRKKANSPEEPWNHKARESISIQEQKLQVPVRRSQKLSDKITALQKLVSPYGKADTASVLLEASLHIKLLQEQIQNLFQMLTSSRNSTRPIQQSQETDGELRDLQSRGLCLVPVSFMLKND